MKPWLITGASGLLGNALVRHIIARGHPVTALHNTHPITVGGAVARHVDLLDEGASEAVILEARPAVIIHAAAFTDVDGCERDPERARLMHATVTERLVRIADKIGARFLYVSTDHLWRGERPLVCESEPSKPLNVYARTKLDGEMIALQNPASLVVRTNFFGPGLAWRRSFSDWILDRLHQGIPVPAFTDVYFTPIAYDLLCPLIIDLIETMQSGIWHLAGGERVSKYEFARHLAVHARCDPNLVVPNLLKNAQLTAPRPLDMSLSTKKAAQWFGHAMPSVELSLNTLPTNYLKERKRQ